MVEGRNHLVARMESKEDGNGSSIDISCKMKEVLHARAFSGSRVLCKTLDAILRRASKGERKQTPVARTTTRMDEISHFAFKIKFGY